MEKDAVFTYSYSAAANKEVQAIRNKYLPKEENKLDELRRLDRRVQNAGMIEALSFGIAGCLVFGMALCMGLEVISGGVVFAVILAILGVAIMIPAYFVYSRLQNKAKEAYVPRILELAEELENHNHN